MRCTSCGQPLGRQWTDRVTGLLDRWGWDDQAPAILAAGCRRGLAMSVLMVDLDRFKDLNDTVGHLAGDRALRAAALALRLATSAIDPAPVCCRFGGDEFVLLLPNTEATTAVKMANRIRAAVQHNTRTLDGGPSMRLTVSIGVAACPPGRTVVLDELVGAADDALRAAKAHGRDRVEVGSADPVRRAQRDLALPRQLGAQRESQ
nr:GGDEF domain-containing protein [Kutzneria albida]